jgi:hypothetical protein
MLTKIMSYMKKYLKMDWKPKCCMCDFELSFSLALMELGIDHRGCYFHLKQAVHRRMAAIGLKKGSNDAYDRISSITSLLFFASTDELFKVYLTQLKSVAPEQFYTYFYNEWVGDGHERANRWSRAYQTRYQSFHPDIDDAVRDEIESQNTNCLSEGRNNADRQLFCEYNLGCCPLKIQIYNLHASFCGLAGRYDKQVLKGQDNVETDNELAAFYFKRSSDYM